MYLYSLQVPVYSNLYPETKDIDGSKQKALLQLNNLLSPPVLHRKKKVREFPVPSRDVTTKLSLGGKMMS